MKSVCVGTWSTDSSCVKSREGTYLASSSATFKKSAKNDSGSLSPLFPSILPTFQPANLARMSMARSIAHNSIHASACSSFARLSTVPPPPRLGVLKVETTSTVGSRGGSEGGGRSEGDEMRVSWPERKSETRVRVRDTFWSGSEVRRMRLQKETRVLGGEEKS